MIWSYHAVKNKLENQRGDETLSDSAFMNLLAYLEQQFEAEGGCLSFREFMALALYSPEFGYYTRNIETVGGRASDFTTWAIVGDLGICVATWIKQELNHYSWNKKIHLIEVGGGDGSLARQVMKNLGWRLRNRVQYHLVDISEPLQKQQQQSLRKFRNTHWHSDIKSALKTSDGRALIFSNELVDAFPIDWLRWNGQAWDEVYLQLDRQTGLSEIFQNSRIDPPNLEFPIKPGQRIELHNSYREWLIDWADSLVEGSVLTIDYGDTSATAIYQRKPNGTVRSYYKQQRIDAGGIYQRFGKQDLTCDVNFDDLKTWGEQLGWRTVSLENQSHFMERMGAGILPDKETEAAESFQVLHQRLRLSEQI